MLDLLMTRRGANPSRQVADLIKLDRLHRLNDLVNECAGERSQRCVVQPHL